MRARLPAEVTPLEVRRCATGHRDTGARPAKITLEELDGNEVVSASRPRRAVPDGSRLASEVLEVVAGQRPRGVAREPAAS